MTPHGVVSGPDVGDSTWSALPEAVNAIRAPLCGRPNAGGASAFLPEADRLKAGTTKIAENVEAVAQGSGAALSRACKAQFGVTPAAFRKRRANFA